MTAATPGIEVRKAITFATQGDVKLQADLYLPEGSGPFPAVIGVPGGAWMFSQRQSLASWGEYLAKCGIALFAIEYRVSRDQKTFPHSACDVVSAVQFVRGTAAELGIDPERIGLIGSSAGAHLAALAALAGNEPLFRASPAANDFADVDTAVKAFAGIYGAYDLLAHWQDEIADLPRPQQRRSECFLGCPPFADRKLYFDASPISYIRDMGNKPFMFIAYGTEDKFVKPESNSLPFLRALKQAGFMALECPVIGAGHFWFSDEPVEEPGSFASFLAPRLNRFLQRFLVGAH